MDFSSGSGQTLEDIKIHALSIIDKSLNLHDLLKEIQNENSKEHSYPDFLNATITDYIDLYSSTLSVSKIQAIENIFLQFLNQLTSSFKIELSLEEKRYFQQLLVISKDCIDSDRVLHNVKGLKHCIPLDALQLLIKEKIFEISPYLKCLVENGAMLKEFISALQRLSQSTKQDSIELVSEILICLVESTCNVENEKALEKVAHYILHKVFKDILSKQLEQKGVLNLQQTDKSLNVFESLCKSSAAGLKKCLNQQLMLWFTSDCSYKVSDAVKLQPTWFSCKLSRELLTSYKHILKAVGVDLALATLQKTISNKEVNWKNVLTVVSSVLISFQDAEIRLKDVILDEIRLGFESRSLEHLIVGILFARQCALEGNHLFQSYSLWFQGTFASTDAAMPQTAASFRLFAKLFRDLLPCEPAQFLRVQILKAPHPTNETCRKILHDYLALARARLSELKPTSSAAINSPLDEDNQTKVDEMIDIFAKTKRIPSTLTEMSMFRKKQFHEKFLPALLRPRVLPEVMDDRMKLISTLAQQGKVSRALLEKYEAGCIEEREKLHRETMDLDASGAFLSFEEKLTLLKSSIVACFTKSDDAPDHVQSVHRCLTDLIEEIDDHVDDVISSTIDFTKSRRRSEQADKVTKSALEALSEVETQAIDVSKARHLVAVFSSHRQLKVGLSQKALNAHTVSEQQTTGVALFLVGTLNESDWTVRFQFDQSNFSVHERRKKFCPPKQIPSQDCSLIAAVIGSTPFRSSEFLARIRFWNAFLDVMFRLRQVPEFEGRDKILGDIYWHVYFAETRLEASDDNQRECSAPYGPEPKRRKQDTRDCHRQLYTRSRDNRKLLGDLLGLREKRGIPVFEFAVREILVPANGDFLTESQRTDLYARVFFSSEVTSSDMSDVMHVLFNSWKELCTSHCISSSLLLFLCGELQSLVAGRGRDVSAADWLIEFLRSRKAIIESEYHGKLIALEHHLSEFDSQSCQLLLHLPWSFLFDAPFTSASNHSIDKSRLQSFVDAFFRNDFWREIATANNAVSRKLASHLVQGLLQCNPGLTHVQVGEMAAENPSLFVSILISWDNQHRLRFLSETRWPNLCRYVEAITSLSSPAPSRGNIKYASDLFEVDVTHMSVVCAYLVCHLDTSTGNKSKCIEEVLKRLQTVHKKFPIVFLRTVLQAAAAHLKWGKPLESLFEIFTASLQFLTPDETMACIDPEDHESCRIFPDRVSKHLPAATLKLLMKSSLSASLLSHAAFLSSVVQAYTKSLVTNAEIGNKWQVFLPLVCNQTPSPSLKSLLQKSDLDVVTKSILKTEAYRRVR